MSVSLLLASLSIWTTLAPFSQAETSSIPEGSYQNFQYDFQIEWATESWITEENISPSLSNALFAMYVKADDTKTIYGKPTNYVEIDVFERQKNQNLEEWLSKNTSFDKTTQKNLTIQGGEELITGTDLGFVGYKAAAIEGENFIYYITIAENSSYNDVFADIVSNFDVMPLSSFSDVKTDHKNKTAIEYLVKKGVLQGYSDGTFKPDQTVNRAELLKIFIEGQDRTPDEGKYKNCFPDVKSDWYAKYVCYAKEQKWIQGYSDGTFKPEQTVNKVEAIKMLIETYGLLNNSSFYTSTEITAPETGYIDTDNLAWYAQYIALAKQKALLEETGISFDPSGGMKRAGIAENLYRLLQIQEKNLTTYPGVIYTEWKTYVNLGEGYQMEYPSTYSLKEIDTRQTKFEKNTETYFMTRVQESYKKEGKEFAYLDYSPTDVAYLGDQQGYMYILDKGYCDGPGCSPPMVVVAAEKNEKIYALEFYNTTKLNEEQEDIVRNFKFL
ncbi:S-layer homology domain-containing protein [Candidatus Peregrinibacteria bacterium]|nr:S-layer homology domain-containing protein [Candidatus Peregrinibacteria bacterium]